MADEVLIEQRDRVLLITINRPDARNAVNRAVSQGLPLLRINWTAPPTCPSPSLPVRAETFAPEWISRPL